MATGSEKELLSKDAIEWQLANMRLLNQGDPRIKSHTAALETASHLESLLAVAVEERDRALLFIKRSIAYSKPIHGGTQWVAFVGGGMALPQSVFAALGIGEGGT